MGHIMYHSASETALQKRRTYFDKRIAAVERKFNAPSTKLNVMEQLIAMVKKFSTK